MKRAFIVLGPESSGTRLTTRLLIAAGCEGGDGRAQVWDTHTPTADLIVWRRSVPHGGEWPDIGRMLVQLEWEGYAPFVVITIRDWLPTIRSQVANHPPGSEKEAIAHIREAYRQIFNAIGERPFDFANYDALVARPQAAADALLKRIGLPSVEGVPIFDGNAKHYEAVAV